MISQSLTGWDIQSKVASSARAKVAADRGRDMHMRVDDFDYELPEELIAQTPIERRDASRLMVLRRDVQSIEHMGSTIAFRTIREIRNDSVENGLRDPFTIGGIR
jgi:hypothetical protein